MWSMAVPPQGSQSGRPGTCEGLHAETGRVRMDLVESPAAAADAAMDTAYGDGVNMVGAQRYSTIPEAFKDLFDSLRLLVKYSMSSQTRYAAIRAVWSQ